MRNARYGSACLGLVRAVVEAVVFDEDVDAIGGVGSAAQGRPAALWPLWASGSVV